MQHNRPPILLSVCILLSLLEFWGCKPEPKPAAQSTAQPAGSGTAPAPMPPVGGVASAPEGQSTNVPGYATSGKAPKLPPANPSLPPLPWLADIDVRRFIDLPGVDLPDEPPRPQFEYAVTAYDLEKINNNPAVVALLKGMEATYATTDGRCEIWAPGAAVIESRMIFGDRAQTTYFIRNADDPYEFRFTESTVQQKKTDEELLKSTIENKLIFAKKINKKVFYNRDTSQGGLLGAELMCEGNEKETVEITRYFFLDGLAYELRELGPPREGLSPNGKKFFDSLRLRK